MTAITVEISDELKDDLQVICHSSHQQVSDVIRESIRRYVAVEGFRQLRKKMLPIAEAQGILTDEDVFEHLK